MADGAREPRTRAGRDLVFMDPFYLDDILRIEDEAATPPADGPGLREALQWALNFLEAPRYEGRHRTKPRCSEFMPTDSTCDCDYGQLTDWKKAARAALRAAPTQPTGPDLDPPQAHKLVFDDGRWRCRCEVARLAGDTAPGERE